MKFSNRKWLTNMVQPQVYGDSLSYYEVLNKLCSAIDELYDLLDGKITESSEYLISKFLNDKIAKMVYHTDTKNITFTFDEIVGDSYHAFDPTTSTMTIRDEGDVK